MTFRCLAGRVVLTAVVAATLLSCAPKEPPLPTELAPDQQAREERARQREAWLESLHRTPDDLDWRAIETANWHRHLARLEKGGRAVKAESRWREVGSTNLAGRTHHVAYDPVTHDLWVGSDLGGVWYGQLDPADPEGPVAWEPCGDSIYGHSHQVVRLAGNPEVILKTHGAAWNGEVHRTSNGGATWTVASGVEGRPRRVLAVGETVFAVSDHPNQWVAEGNCTLLKSTDRGRTFTALRDVDGFRGDIWAPSADGPLYLLSDVGLEVSHDLGAGWSLVGELPVAATRGVLTGSGAGGPHLYAALDVGDGTWSLAASTDGGATWEVRYQIEDFWGDLTSLAASTVDPSLVLYAGVDAYRSVDGGHLFARINNWSDYYWDPLNKLHADITALDFVSVPGGDELLFISTDGGLYVSRDGGASVYNLSLDGLRISQYYSTLSDPLDPTRIMAGSQDQGFQLGTVDGGFEQLLSGDYGQLTSSDGTLDLVYSTYPGFVLVAERLADGVTRLHYNTQFPPFETHHWLPFLLADPDDPETFYFCARQIYRYTRGDHDIWRPEALPHLFAEEQGEFVSALAIAPADSDRWYAATSHGALWYSRDRGETWSLSAFSDGPAPDYLTGMAFAADPDEPRTVYVGGSGYAEPAVYRSLDGGISFAAFSEGLPSTLVYDLTIDRRSGDLFAATQSGPYRWTSETGAWASLLDGSAPMTTYWSVEALQHCVRFGTYGRGIWDWALTPPRRTSGRAR